MTPERWQQVEDIFQTALDLAPEERERYVTKACADDADLKRQVESLLTQYAEAGDLLTQTLSVPHGLHALAAIINDESDPLLGRRLGAYRIEREVGRGGMGAVYEAVRADNVFRKRVAIKLVKRGMDTDFILRRFRNERQILAALDHLNIARLLDGGTTDDGLPYFVMEYIEGQPLYRYCDEQRLSVAERLRLFLSVCDAVRYAHQKHVIHRDIKPSNILVTTDGVAKLLDFGIAKLLDPELAAETVEITLTAVRLMTPEYASPEQVKGEPVTPASDIYSLGVMLYELLSGHRPYQLKHRALHEVARVICEEEPLSLVTSLTRETNLVVSRGESPTLDALYLARNASPESLRRELSGDLERIIMKTLRKEPHERYQSAAELRDDITRYLEGRPVAAPPYVRASARPARAAARANADELSIAVLPFKLIGPRTGDDTGDEYLGIGLADALITRLSNVRRFVVRPTSSVLAYSGSDTGEPLAAGNQLGVAYLIDGNIRRAGDTLRVTVQLLQVSEGATRWAGRFDEKLTDVLRLEDSISEQVANALIPQLTGEEQEQLAKRGTDDAQAFEAYMRGRYHWHSLSEEGFAKAMREYHRAIALDPSYALAYAGIADYYIFLGIFGVLPFSECAAAAYEAAERAIELDAALAEAHAALAFAMVCRDFDWGAAEAHHRRALELNPNNATAHNWYNFCLLQQGRFDESLAEVRRAIELDPVTPLTTLALAWCHYQARRFDEALAVHRTLIQSEPRFAYQRSVYSWVLRCAGQHEEAIIQAEKAAELAGDGQLYLAGLGMAYAAAGRVDQARAVVAQLQEMARAHYVSPYFLAVIYSYLGEPQAALDEIEEALRIRDAWVCWLVVDPQLDGLRGEPRFAELVRQTNNPAAVGQPATAAKAEAKADTGSTEKSIAVLPLKLLGAGSNDDADKFLGVGLADALITRLSSVRRLIVRPTSAVLRYGEPDADPFQAGRQLGVQFILEGHIRKAGERLRVSVQLLNVTERTTVWAERFDGEFTDVLSVEDEISTRAARTVIPHLTTDEHEHLVRRGTSNTEAYEAYLRGRFHWNQFTIDSFTRAAAYFRRALALDPDYALAYVGLADCVIWGWVGGGMTPHEGLAAAERAASRAIALDDSSGEAYVLLGAIQAYSYNWKEAERSFNRARQLSPNYAWGYVYYSIIPAIKRDFVTAIELSRRAIELDPLSSFNQQHLGWVLYHARRFDEALAQFRKTIEHDPDFAHARGCYGIVLSQLGRYEEALEQIEHGMQLVGESATVLTFLADVYAKMGRVEDARAIVARLGEQAATDHSVSFFHLAITHCLLGERDAAFACLEKAVQRNETWLMWLSIEPQFDGLRDDPRFGELLRRTNNPAAPRPKAPDVKAETGGAEKSVAVLPFKVICVARDENTDDRFLGIGLADALITRLGNLRRIKVRPTSSVARFSQDDSDPLEAGRALGVSYVLDGRIQHAGERVRVTVQLISIDDQTPIWARQFNEPFTDVLGIQDSISEQVAEVLVPQLTGDERRRLAKRGTDSAEALEAYMRGRYHWNTMSEDGFAKALFYYQRAVSLDPAYAAAYAGISEYYCWQAVYGLMPPDETLAAARQAAERAVALDDSLADAYTAYALSLLTDERQWQAAEARYRRAIERNPNYAPAHAHYACQLGMEGRFDESLGEASRACDIDPLNPFTAYFRAWCLYQARRYDESIAKSRLLLQSDPRYGSAYFMLSWALRRVGQYDEVVAHARKAIELLGDIPMFVASLGAAYAETGQIEAARRVLAQLREMTAERYVTPYHRALVHVHLGEPDEAMALLEQSVANSDPWIVWLATEPQLDPLRADSRFVALLDKVIKTSK